VKATGIVAKAAGTLAKATGPGRHEAPAMRVERRYNAIREEDPMDGTVDVMIPVDARAAGELRDARTRDAIGRLVSLVLQRQRQENVNLLFAAIEQLGDDAEAKGLTDTILEEELAAYNAERRR
jgi:hypothetical protein